MFLAAVLNAYTSEAAESEATVGGSDHPLRAVDAPAQIVSPAVWARLHQPRADASLDAEQSRSRWAQV